MKTKSFRTLSLLLALVAGFLSPRALVAAEKHGHKDGDASSKARAPYPLTVCAVSGDKLEDGDMGPPIDHLHKVAGKPDRLVRLCCKSCIKQFNKEPAKYLKMIDDAAAGKAPNPADHAKHKH
ncbi:MAG: hypothetical protein Q8N18_13915 [Opitutaceae bacterium]|nr:hypothetical protein [Opitutaceae bacterium]